MITHLLLAALLSTAPLPDSVYVSPMGEKFHAKCHTGECALILRVDAEAAGYGPCQRCFSPKPKKLRPWDKLRGAK